MVDIIVPENDREVTQNLNIVVPDSDREINFNEMPQDWRNLTEGRSDRFLMQETFRTPEMMNREDIRNSINNNNNSVTPGTDPNVIKETFRPWDGMDINEAKKNYKKMMASEQTDIDDRTGFLTLQRDGKRDMIIPPPNTKSNIPFLSKEDLEWLQRSPFAVLFPQTIFSLSSIDAQEEAKKLEDPNYDPNEPKEAVTGMKSQIVGMGSDFYGEVIAFGGDVISWGANKASEKMELDWPELNLGDYGRSFPEVETDNLGDLLFLEGTLPAASYILPVTWVKRATDAGKLAINTVPKAWRKFYSRFIAETAGSVSMITGLESDSGGLFVGEDALIRLWDGVAKGDEESQQKLANSWNLLLDVAMTNTVLRTAGLTVIGAYNFIADGLVSPIYTVLAKSEEGLKRQFVNDLLVQFTKNIDSPKDVELIKEEMSKLLTENSEIVLDMAKGDPTKKANVKMDSLNALKFGFNKNAKELETLKAIEKPNKNQVQLIKELEKKQTLLEPTIIEFEKIVKGFETKGTTSLTANKQATFQKEIKSNIDEISSSATDETFLDASEAITKGVKADTGLDDAVSTVEKLEKQQIVDTNTLTDLAKGDAILGSKIDNLVKEFNNNPTLALQGKQIAGENISTQLDAGAELITKTKDDLYNAIQGGSVDIDGLYTALNGIKQRENALIKASGEVSNNKPFSKLLKIFDKKQITETIDGKKVKRDMTDEDYIAELQKILQKNKIDFGVLYRDIRPELTNLIIDPNISVQAKQAFVTLRDFIDNDSLEHLMATGSPEIAKKAKEAKNYYSSVFGEYFRQGDELESWYNNWVANARKKKPEGTDLEGQFLKGDAFVQNTWDFLDEIAFNPNRSKTLTRVSDILTGQTPSTVSNKNDLLIYIMNDTLVNLKNKVAGIGGIGEISEKTVIEIQTQLGKLGLPLRAAGFADEANQIDNFVSELTKARGNATFTEKKLELASRTAIEARKKLNQSVLKNFFQTDDVKNGLDIDVIPTDSPYEVIAKILNPNNINQKQQIEKLLELGANDPAIIDALRASYGRYLLDTIFTGRKTNIGTEGVRPNKLNLDGSQYNKLIETGKAIFQDGSIGIYDSKTMETLEAFGVILRNLEEGRLSGSVGQSGTAPAQGAMNSVGKLVNFVIGPLQRTGARVTALAKGIIERAGPNELIEMLADQVLANPEEMAWLTKQNIDWLSQETKYDMYKTFVRAGIYSDDEEKSWEDLYDASVDILDAGSSAINVGKNILGKVVNTVSNIASLGTRPQ